MPSKNYTVTVYSIHSRPDDPYVFADCTWKVTDGCLHIFRAPEDRKAEPTTMVAAFAADTKWFAHSDAEVWSL